MRDPLKRALLFSAAPPLSASLCSPPALVFVAEGFGVRRNWCGGKGFVLLSHWGLTRRFLMGFTVASVEQNRPGVAQLKEGCGRVNIVRAVSPHPPFPLTPESLQLPQRRHTAEAPRGEK